MTAPLTDYVTYDDIRAALGVAPEEIEDATLALALYANTLEVDLEDVQITLPALYQTKKALQTPTEDEARFLQATTLFATYAVARHLTTVLPMFAPKDVTDGKAAINRAFDPYKKTVENIEKLYGRFRTRLDQMFAVVNSTSASATTTKIYISAAAPASDPVTGT